MDFPEVFPEDYYSGEKWEEPLPEKVLLFTRTDRFSLDKTHIHRHSRFNLILSLSGSCRILIDRELINIPSGGMLLIHPWQSFHFLYDSNEPLEWIFLGFDLQDRNKLLKLNEVRLMSRTIISYCRDIVSRFRSKGSGPWLVPYLMIILEDYNQTQVQDLERLPYDSGNELILKIQRIMLDNMNQPITISDIGERCSYSTSRLREIFKKYTGESLGAYMRRIKLNEAARVLVQSELNISEISETFGFSTLYAFSRTFKNYYGMSPMAFRKQFRE